MLDSAANKNLYISYVPNEKDLFQPRAATRLYFFGQKISLSLIVSVLLGSLLLRRWGLGGLRLY